MSKSSKIRTWQLVSPSHSRVEWLKSLRLAENAVPSNSPQEAAVASLLGPALGDSLELSQLFSKWSVASERYLKSECQLEGSVRRAEGRGGGARDERPAPNFPLEALKRVDEFASEGQGHLFWACVQGRLLEVKRCMERGTRNCGLLSKIC